MTEEVDEEVNEGVDEEERRNPRCNTMLRSYKKDIHKYTNQSS